MDGYAVRMAMEFKDLIDLITYKGAWYDMADQIICYEHPHPPASRTHCHLLIINPTHCVRSFKDKSGLPNGGNSMWSFKPIAREAFERYITYMSKGIYDPKEFQGRNKLFTIENLNDLKTKWVSRPTVVKYSKSQQEYYDWLAKFKTKAQYIALVENKDNLNKDDPLIQIVKRDAANYLIAKNDGFYNQNVANQITNFVRSFLHELNYRI